MHVDEEWIVEAGEDVPLIHDRFDATFGNNSCLTHFFHGKHGTLFFPFNTPDFAETPLTNAEMIDEVGFAHS